LRPPRLTRLGARVAIEAEWQTYSVELAAKTELGQVSGDELARVYALFGPQFLVDAGLSQLARLMPAPVLDDSTLNE
jgi:hypothetical protein